MTIHKVHIDWKAVWKEFDAWWDRNAMAPWEKQERKIQSLVKKYSSIV